VKKIVYIGGFKLPDKNAAAFRVLANAEILEKLGYQVVLLGSSEKAFSKGRYYENFYPYISFRIFESGYPATFLEWLLYETSIKEIENILNNLEDVSTVICYDCPGIVLYRLKRLLSKRNIKLVSDTTEWFLLEGKNLVHAFVKYFDTFFRMKISNLMADGLIVSSEFLKKYYLKRNVRNICVIPTLIPTGIEDVWLKDNQFSEENRLCNFYTNIVYSGIPFRIGKRIRNRHIMKDRLDVILKLLLSAKRAKIDFCFHIFGITKEEYLKSLPKDKSILEELSETLAKVGCEIGGMS